MGQGLGGQQLAQMESRIKASSGATPGDDAYAKQYGAYTKNPATYGQVKKAVVKESPIKKAIGGRLGDTAQKLVDNRNNIKKYGVLGNAYRQLTK